MGLYVAVTTTTMIVSVLGLTALSIVRLERRQGAAINERLHARMHSRSAVEWALRALATYPTWRSGLAHGIETTPAPLAANGVGTVSFSVVDSDFNLTNPDVSLRLKGFGRVGNSVQVSSIELAATEVSGMLRNYELANDSGHSLDDVKSDKWFAQFFRPTLPTGANGWRITGAEVRIRRQNTNRAFQVRLYRTSVTGPVLESVDFNSNAVSTSLVWFPVTFSGGTWLAADESACLAVESASSTAPIRISYKASGVSESQSGLVRGSPAYGAREADKALQYRIHGVYSTSAVQPVAGTWQWDTP